MLIGTSLGIRIVCDIVLVAVLLILTIQRAREYKYRYYDTCAMELDKMEETGPMGLTVLKDIPFTEIICKKGRTAERTHTKLDDYISSEKADFLLCDSVGMPRGVIFLGDLNRGQKTIMHFLKTGGVPVARAKTSADIGVATEEILGKVG